MASAKKILLKILKYILLFGVAGLLVFLAFRKVDWKAFWEGLLMTRWFCVVIFCIVSILALVGRTIRWKALLDPFDKDISMLRVWDAVNVGNIASIAIPTSGELLRCGYVTTKKLPYDKALGTMFAAPGIIRLLVDIGAGGSPGRCVHSAGIPFQGPQRFLREGGRFNRPPLGRVQGIREERKQAAHTSLYSIYLGDVRADELFHRKGYAAAGRPDILRRTVPGGCGQRRLYHSCSRRNRCISLYDSRHPRCLWLQLGHRNIVCDYKPRNPRPGCTDSGPYSVLPSCPRYGA